MSNEVPGGKKADNNKPDMSLIPAAAAIEEAHVWTFGKRKYDAYNWHKGIVFSRILAAIERHLTLLKAGQDFDYENGYHNAAAIRCGCAMLIQFTMENRTELDDRMQLSPRAVASITNAIQGTSIQDCLNLINEEMKSEVRKELKLGN